METGLTLVLGGARSGKSAYAEALISVMPPPWTYLATAEAFDDEMRARIAEHRARRDTGWVTVEAPVDLAHALSAVPEGRPVLIECLTLWLTNLILGNHDLESSVAALEAVLDKRVPPTVAVANEVGLGIVPENALARRFRDEAGRLNQRLAQRAGRVLFMVAGLPTTVKDDGGIKD